MTDKRNIDSTPQDQDQRDIILTELDINILVEAAAGTGKTTSMIGRMIELLASGKCRSVTNLVAVTFTRKAAAELKSKFRVKLEEAKANRTGENKRNLEAALLKIDQCFINTIHSFCARLLRERPVEANVDIGFEELEEDTDLNLRKEAWKEYSSRLVAHDPQNILGDLLESGIRLATLEDIFLNFANYPDVTAWPVPEGSEKYPHLSLTIEQLFQYSKHMNDLSRNLPLECGSDLLIPEYRRIPRVLNHCKNIENPGELASVLGCFDKTVKVTQKEWKKEGKYSAEDAKKELERWENFRKDTVVPFLRYLREKRYMPIIKALNQAKDIYDELRRNQGKLNYQDLLMKVADMLRSKPNIRRYFAERYTHLLVDEFQDTDPIQAQVMLYLTSNDYTEKDWRKWVPRPGSLFVVGDPKQSIYRFRRADIVTYKDVENIICNSRNEAGRKVILSANFRSEPSIIDWINNVFEPSIEADKDSEQTMLRFNKESSAESPAYVSLTKGRELPKACDLSGIYSLIVPGTCTNNENVIEYDSERIALTIRQLIDSKTAISRTPQEITVGKPPYVTPSDCMIITRNRKHLGNYAEKLQKYFIPHRVTGGNALNRINELGLLYSCVLAVTRPDDQIALVGVLRSELFGISDAELYAYKKAGGAFSYNSEVPKNLAIEVAEHIGYVFNCLRKYYRWFFMLPPITTIENIIDDSGLAVLASIQPGGDIEAGCFAKAIEIMRAAEGDMWTVSQLIEFLEQLVNAKQTFDGISVRSEEEPAVRVMNLHQVKGLEAPVVFLADPTGEREHSITYHIDRSHEESRGYFAIYEKKSEYSYSLLAHPANWETYEEIEGGFQRAESLRLRYVAATRAGSALIISRRATKNENNPWKYFEKYLPAKREIPAPGFKSVPVRPSENLNINDIVKSRNEISERLIAAVAPTYRIMGAKEYSLSRPAISTVKIEEPDVDSLYEAGEHGIEWGSVIHLLLQRLIENPKGDLRNMAEYAIAEYDLSDLIIDDMIKVAEKVIKSEIWQRALSSNSRIAEVPFQLLLEEKDSNPTIVRGIIDLVFEEDDGWVLIDYKTDLVTSTKPEALLQKYAAQVNFYAEAWEKCSGQKVKEKGIYSVYANKVFLLP